jgi:aryl-alcohol dehydrogenase-like predicted oxidoreductase
MAAMIEAGKIRHWGLSNETAWGVSAFRRAAQELGVPGPVTVQNSCNLVSRAVEGDLAEAIFREGMSVLPYSPLAGGILTGKYRGNAKPPGARYTRFETVGVRYRKPLVFEASEAYLEVARAHGLTPIQLALGWVRSRWYVGATIVGATSLAQLDENLDAFEVDLDAATLADIAAVQLRYPNPTGY